MKLKLTYVVAFGLNLILSGQLVRCEAGRSYSPDDVPKEADVVVIAEFIKSTEIDAKGVDPKILKQFKLMASSFKVYFTVKGTRIDDPRIEVIHFERRGKTGSRDVGDVRFREVMKEWSREGGIELPVQYVLFLKRNEGGKYGDKRQFIPSLGIEWGDVCCYEALSMLRHPDVPRK